MCKILELIQKRDNLIIELASLNHDLKEYSEYPVETVDLEQLKYQHSYIIKEIQQIAQKINLSFNSQVSNYKNQFIQTEKKITETISKKEFTVNDLPRLHHSFFAPPLS